MQTLTKKTRLDLATRINAVAVADIMCASAQRDNNPEKYARWLREGDVAIIALADDYGIELPTLPRAAMRQRERLAVAA